MAQSNSDPTPSLDGLPPEIRRMIFKPLLINDDLADIDIVWSKNYGVTAKYGLSPGILRICRLFYGEVVDILYSNTFAIDCIGNAFDDLGAVFPSPLTRFSRGNNPTNHLQWNRRYKLEDGYKRIRDIPAFPRIRNWKVTVEDAVWSTRAHERHSAISAFCKAICRTPLDSLEICMHCKDCAEKEDNEPSNLVWPPDSRIGIWWCYNATSYFDILEPLQMLRNIQTLKFKCPKCEGRLRLLTEHEEKFLRFVIKEGSTPELLFQQYEQLLIYCRTFERWEPFRRKMGHNASVITAPKFNRQRFNPYQYDNENSHPVESGLLRARKASNYDDRKSFHNERRLILEYLEPQYQRLSKLMDKLVDSVKEEKVARGILGESLCGDVNQLQKVKFHLLLEDVAAAFTRDIPPGIRVLMRAIIDQTYNGLNREQCLKAMNESLDVDDYVQQRPNHLQVPVVLDCHHHWQYHVKSAGADMDRQWLEIRKARRGLFEFDTDGEKGGCKIDVEEWRYDDPIAWDVMEPWIGPMKE